MATENVPEKSGAPDGDDAAGLTPLSFFFPTITEAESRCLDGETFRIAERRAKVADLYSRGWSMDTIRVEMKCSVGTVWSDIHTVLEGYRKIAARSAADHLASMLQLIAYREAQVVADLDRSRGEFLETMTNRRTGRSGDFNQASVKKRQKYGDPKLHAILQGYVDRRCKLYGLLNAEDFKDVRGIPPVKLVAGFDPVESA